MTSPKVAVEINNVSKSYKLYDRPIDRLREALNPFGKEFSRQFQALSNISISINRGETFGVIGKNGAGKSTLLKIVSGVLQPSQGSVKVNGKISSLLELGTGFDPELTGLENAYYYSSLIGMHEEEMDSRIDSILGFAQIGDFIHQPVKTYSSGMFARLAFSVAINVDPDVLIVDEVLSVGDAAFQKKCISRINSLRESDVTIIFVSHDDYLIRKLCQRAIYLADGCCRILGEPEECLMHYHAQDANNIETRVYEQANTEAEDGQTDEVVTANVVKISSVTINNNDSEKIEVEAGDDMLLEFEYSYGSNENDLVSFVANIYTADGIYVWGTTTLMDHVDPFRAGSEGRVMLRLLSIPLLSGIYTVRVAINDETGMAILAEANPALEFVIRDKFQSAGLVDLKREWSVMWKD